MTNRSSQTNSFASGILAALLLTLFLSEVMSAQQSKIVEGGVVNGIPYASTGFENINMTNGNLSLSFPLASLQGRGQASFSYYMTYNSKLWRTQSNPVYNPHYQPNPTYQNFLGDSLEGGWRVGDAYELNVWNRQSGMDAPTGNVCSLGTRWMLVHQWKVTIDAPDGRKIEFRPTGYSDIEPGSNPGIGTGYFAVQPNGSVNSVSGSSSNCNHSTSPPTYQRTTYYSSDGSGIRLTFANGEPLGFVWEMSMPDGSKIAQLPGKQRITDRNGNYVEQAIVTLPDSSQASGWIDQVGRYVARKADTGPDEDTYYQLGFNGELLTWKVRWKNVYVLRNYVTTCITCPAGVRGPVIDTQASMEFRVIDQIVLPTQLGVQPYEFEYHAKDQQDQNLSSGWGEVKSITMPSGASVNYGYKLSALTSSEAYDEILSGEIFMRVDQILERAGTLNKKKLIYSENYDDQTAIKEDIWHYGISRTGSSVTAPGGSTVYQIFYDIVNDEQKGGQVYKEIKADGTVVERVWANNLPVGVNYGSGARLNAFVKTEFTTITDAMGNPSLTAIKDYDYDRNGNALEVAEYDWIPASSPAILRDAGGKVTGFTGLMRSRSTATSYYNPTPSYASQAGSANPYYLSSAPTLRNLAEASEARNSSGTPVSRTEITYDNSSTPTNGNPTQTRTWDSTKGVVSYPLTASNAIIGSVQYDSYGNPTLTTDAKGTQTQITYGSVNGFTGLYPTQTISAYQTSIARTSNAAYDFNTGLVSTATDVDNNVSVVTEYDALGRPTKVRTAAGTALESWTRTEYNDVARRVIVRSDLETIGDGKKVAIQHYDQLGRVRLSRSIENIATEDPYNETHGIKVQSRYKYDNGANAALNGTYSLTSNPYRAAISSAATNEPTMGWTVGFENKSDSLKTTETFGGVSLPAPWGSNPNPTGFSKVEEDANASTTTDEAGKKRRTITDGLGRLVRVDEPDANGDLGSTASPYQPTSYSYDTLGNLLQIQQIGSNTQQCGTTSSCTQTRTFGYSSLSRLLSATNPESGTFQYSYDSNGNLLTKTDARNVSTTYTYDALNRATFRNYSDATPDITYTYDDVQIARSKGKLTKVSSSVSETRFTQFDEQERVKESKQINDGQTYTFGYTYNLDDSLKTQTYPSGKVATFDYDGGGDLAAVWGQTGQAQKLYASQFSYAPHGQVEKMRLGNGRWESTQFNSARQITQVGLGYSPGNTGLLKINYEYGELQTNGSVDGLKNNGNLAKQAITVPTIAAATGFVANQSYTYDSLDRLKSAAELISGQTWKQTFNYDRFGNKTFDVANTTIISSESAVPKIANPEILSNSNKYKQDQDNDSQPDYLYDTSGNITKNARQQDFTYDAENRQITAIGPGLSTSYFYDGNGKRVKSYNSINGQTTVFVYDGDGDLAAEYTVNVPPPTNPTISYLTEDALGSVRVTTNSFGEVKARRDFLPFGEELYAGLAGRNINQKYSSNTDDTRKKFATYQRDAETGLDFAQSRYYSPMQGRFTSPDEFKGGPDELFDFEAKASDNPTFYADLMNPQSLNKYQYTANNPYKYNDPTGHCFPLWACWADRVSRSPTGQRFIEAVTKSSVYTTAAAAASAAGAAIGRAGAEAVKSLGRSASAGIGDASCPSCTSSQRMGQNLMMSKSSNQPSNAATVPTNQTGASSVKEAVKGAHKEVGKQKERGKGKFGSPMRGNSKTKGYRLDPPNPRGQGKESTNKHVNWWDYSKGNWNNGKGPGRKGSIFIE